MKLLFATLRAYLPDSVSGAEWCTDTLLRGLVARGHACEVVAAREPGLRGHLERAIDRISGRFPRFDTPYPVNRCPEREVLALLEARVRAQAPDVVVTHLRGSEEVAARALGLGRPVVVLVRDAEFSWFTGALSPGPRVVIVANSRFVAGRVRERLSVEPEVLLPLVSRERFLAAPAGRRCVTFVNPVRLKGADVALALAAALPRQPFLFVRNWRLRPAMRAHLKASLGRLPNVTLLASREDMRPIYARTAVLLAPSQWEESFPRVAVEAQLNGIPVLGSAVGGMGEAVGDGGLLLPRDAAVETWVAALERLLAPGEDRERMVANARRSAARPELDPERIVDAFLGIAGRLVAAA